MSNKPHILLLAPIFPPFKGAVASRLHSLANYWSEFTRVTVISPYEGFPDQPYDLINFPLTRYRWEFLRILYLLPRLLRLARGLKPDVVVASIPPAWPLVEGHLLARRLGCEFILDVRDLPTADVRRTKTSLFRGILHALMIFISRHFGRKASRIVTVTDWFRKELIRFLDYPPSRVFVIRNGSETELFEKALSVKKEFDIVYSGTLIHVRNPAGILRYLRFLADLYPSLRVLFLSDLDNPIGREFLAGIGRLGLGKNVFIEATRPPEELPGLLGRARLGLNALMPEHPAYRGAIGAKGYEYLAAGLPIVGLLDPDFYIEARRLIADNDVGIIDPDPEKLAEETVKLLKDNWRLSLMSKRARALGERFDRRKQAKDYFHNVIVPAWEESRG